MRLRCLLCIVWALWGLTACHPRPLEDALQGRLPPEESNTLITEYCQTCHIHRAFDPANHTERVQALYDRPPYNATNECRTCHLVRKDAWGARLRKTIWPAQVTAQGSG
jgi:hypothetical protein